MKSILTMRLPRPAKHGLKSTDVVPGASFRGALRMNEIDNMQAEIEQRLKHAAEEVVLLFGKSAPNWSSNIAALMRKAAAEIARLKREKEQIRSRHDFTRGK